MSPCLSSMDHPPPHRGAAGCRTLSRSAQISRVVVRRRPLVARPDSAHTHTHTHTRARARACVSNKLTFAWRRVRGAGPNTATRHSRSSADTKKVARAKALRTHGVGCGWCGDVHHSHGAAICCSAICHCVRDHDLPTFLSIVAAADDGLSPAALNTRCFNSRRMRARALASRRLLGKLDT